MHAEEIQIGPWQKTEPVSEGLRTAFAEIARETVRDASKREELKLKFKRKREPIIKQHVLP